MDNFKNSITNAVEKSKDIGQSLSEKSKDIGQSLSEKSKDIGQSLSEKSKDIGQSLSEKSRNFMSSASPDTNSIKDSFDNLTKTPMRKLLGEEPEPSFDFSFFKSFGFWAIIILILAILGFNIFKYLSEGTDIISSIVSPIVSAFGILTGETVKTTLSNTATGTKKIVDTTSSASQNILDFVGKSTDKGIDFISSGTTSGINMVENRLKKNLSTVNTVNDDEDDDDDEEDESENDNVVKNRNNTNNNNNNNRKQTKSEPEPTRSSSQQHGYCYIGKINDVRHCSKISSRNKCMSGDIFPSMDICINPKLRS